MRTKEIDIVKLTLLKKQKVGRKNKEKNIIRITKEGRIFFNSHFIKEITEISDYVGYLYMKIYFFSNKLFFEIEKSEEKRKIDNSTYSLKVSNSYSSHIHVTRLKKYEIGKDDLGTKCYLYVPTKKKVKGFNRYLWEIDLSKSLNV